MHGKKFSLGERSTQAVSERHYPKATNRTDEDRLSEYVRLTPEIATYFIDDLSDGERVWLYRFRQTIRAKLLVGDRIIDIKSVMNLTKLMEWECRRIINHIEWHDYNFKQFEIINGDKQFQKSDALRATQIQERG
tara:strand:+ start:455 stop:859 length:405 start_codon:yes stop_codon:yes gene_type:complete